MWSSDCNCTGRRNFYYDYYTEVSIQSGCIYVRAYVHVVQIVATCCCMYNIRYI